MSLVRHAVALAVFLVAIVIAVLGALGTLDSAGRVGELLQGGQSGAVAVLVMVTIFIAAVWPEIQRQVFGPGAIRARDVERHLRSDILIANMQQYSRARLFYELRDNIAGSGIDTRNWPKVEGVEWKSVLAGFDRDGLLRSSTFHPDMGRRSYQVWQTNDLGNEILRRLIAKPPPPPISVVETQR